jgi:hypothetical protein
MKRNLTSLPRLTMALSALLFGSLALAPPKASAGIEIFLTIDGIPPQVHQISTSGVIYNTVGTIASIVLP